MQSGGGRVGQVQQAASTPATSDGFLNVTHTRAEKSTQTNKSLKGEKSGLIDLFWQTLFFFLSAAVEALKPGDTLLNNYPWCMDKKKVWHCYCEEKRGGNAY